MSSLLATIPRHGPGGVAQWLLLPFQGRLDLVAGESRDEIVSVLAQRLGLVHGQGFVVPEFAASNAEAPVTVYRVELTPEALESLTGQAWVSEREIRLKRSHCGQTIADRVEATMIASGLWSVEEEYDLFVSYAHADDADGWVTAFVEAIQAEHSAFVNRPLRVFFDRDEIHTMQDWEHRILRGLRSARAMLAVMSPTYFSRPWCRREWETYLEHEAARTWPGEPIAPIYTVEVPGFGGEEPHPPDPLSGTERGNQTSDAPRLSCSPLSVPERGVGGVRSLPTTGEVAWMHDLARRQFLDLRPWRPHGVEALRQAAVREELRRLEQTLHQRIEQTTRTLSSFTNADPPNRNFVGRTEELRRLREILALGKVGAIAAVHGLGGIGKTALANRYAHTFAHEYPGGRFWLRVEGVDDLRRAFRQLEAPLGLTLSPEEQRDEDAAHARIRATLEARGTSLVVLDNVDKPRLLDEAHRARYLPDSRKVHVLLTTREQPRSDSSLTLLALDRLSNEDGLKLLQRYRPIGGDEAQWKAALRLVRGLDGHAWSLEVVGVFLWQKPEVTYADYLADLEELGVVSTMEDVGGQVRPGRHDVSLLRQLLGPTLKMLTDAERRALEYAALLPADWVPRPWLRELVGRDFPDAVTRKRRTQPDPWLELERKLHGLRLLVTTDDGPVARTHRLVQAVVLDGVDVERRAEMLTALVGWALGRAKVLWDGWVKREARWEIEPVHQFAWLLMDAEDVRGADLGGWLSEPFRLLGRVNEARTLFCRILQINEKVYDPDHPTLATSYSNLAMVEQDLGNLPEARRLLLLAIQIEEKAYALDHPTLATIYSNLATVEQDLGNLPEARRLLLLAIQIEEKAYEADHPTLAVRYSNLAAVERDLGNLPEARRLLLLAIQIDESAYEADHPNLAVSYSNLAMVEQALGNLPEARRHLLRAIQIEEKAYAPDHPTLAVSYSNLATVEQALGYLSEARHLLLLAIQINEKAYAPDHPTLAICYFNLAWVEHPLGNIADAIALAHKAHAIFHNRLGPDHPHTGIVRRWLDEHHKD